MISNQAVDCHLTNGKHFQDAGDTLFICWFPSQRDKHGN